jgi:hypothetical protein
MTSPTFGLDEFPIDPLAILYLALRSPIGLILEVSDFDRAKARLFRARADAKDVELARLSIRVPSEALSAEGNMIIVKIEK